MPLPTLFLLGKEHWQSSVVDTVLVAVYQHKHACRHAPVPPTRFLVHSSCLLGCLHMQPCTTTYKYAGRLQREHNKLWPNN